MNDDKRADDDAGTDNPPELDEKLVASLIGKRFVDWANLRQVQRRIHRTETTSMASWSRSAGMPVSSSACRTVRPTDSRRTSVASNKLHQARWARSSARWKIKRLKGYVDALLVDLLEVAN
jgi:hypothetical protein